MAIIIGIVGGVSESRFVKAFINGTADMMSVVLIIAMARSITVLMGRDRSRHVDPEQRGERSERFGRRSSFAPMSFLL